MARAVLKLDDGSGKREPGILSWTGRRHIDASGSRGGEEADITRGTTRDGPNDGTLGEQTDCNGVDEGGLWRYGRFDFLRCRALLFLSC